MGQSATRPVVELLDFSGGLNSAEPPDRIGQNQLADVRNLEFRRGTILHRRRGTIKNITGSIPFTALSSVVSLFRHTPGASEGLMELWGACNVTAVVARVLQQGEPSAWYDEAGSMPGVRGSRLGPRGSICSSHDGSCSSPTTNLAAP